MSENDCPAIGAFVPGEHDRTIRGRLDWIGVVDDGGSRDDTDGEGKDAESAFTQHGTLAQSYGQTDPPTAVPLD